MRSEDRFLVSCSVGNKVDMTPNSIKEKDGVHINEGFGRVLSSLLQDCSVEVESNHNIFLDMDITWHSNSTLIIKTKKNITLEATAKIVNKVGGTLYLKSGIENDDGQGEIIFKGDKQVDMADGNVYVYYNPKTRERGE
jgi:hypothetical protein